MCVDVWRLRFLRNKDRDLHADSYPTLRHPELYLLHGGYSDFYGAGHGDLCKPNDYQPMSDRRFAADQARYRAESRVYNVSDRCASRRRPVGLPRSVADGAPACILSPADRNVFTPRAKIAASWYNYCQCLSIVSRTDSLFGACTWVELSVGPHHTTSEV